MARPKKKTVDYFPHLCESGRTLYVLEQKFGNDGYAFWFKLLEILGKTENHYLDLQNQANFEFLQAKTRLSAVDIANILDILCRLGAIDTELWSKRVIWSQNFVDNISDVYINRRVETPKKPSFHTYPTAINQVSTEITTKNGDNESYPTLKSTQSKVKESRGEESKVK